ncbi:MAG: hypothetical protein Q4P30_03245 [Eubacteriales bacterium]|nr:hypothetical protein [Eubacteriales bacterium]
MEKWLIAAAVAVVLIIPAIAYRIRDRRACRRRYAASYGRFAEDAPTERQRAADAAYFKAVANTDTCVDDITASDLDIQRLYEHFNRAQTSAGREYVYAALRMPLYDAVRLAARDERATVFDRDAARRIATEMDMGAVGRLRGRSLHDALQNLRTDGRRAIWSHVVMLVLILAMTGLTIYDDRFGVLLLVAVGFNMTYYFFIRKHFTDPMCIFRYLMSMMVAMNRTYARNADLFPDYAETVRSVNRRLGNIRRFRFLISDGEGDLLSFLLVYINAIFHFDCIYFGRAIGRLRRYGEESAALFEYFGETELALSIASWRRAVPFWSRPDLSTVSADAQPQLEFTDMVHPLIETPVPNSLDVPGPLLITGSNASGKSTFLKAVLLNALTAQTIRTVTARRWAGSYFRILSSMAMRDSLATKESYFVVEVKSLYRITAADDTVPILAGVDEILRGTNTLERIAASAVILEELAKRRVLPVVATHDIELTGLLDGIYHNYHFREALQSGVISFDYRIHEGPSRTRNAIALLGEMGFAADITARADEMAARLAPQMHLGERRTDAGI